MQNDAADATITCDGTYDGVREEFGYEDAPVSLIDSITRWEQMK